MNLFIDSISKIGSVIIFDDNRKILDQIKLEIKGNESSLLILKIDELFKKNNLNYKDINNILVINGPGSFTGIRTTVLLVNTINFIIKNNKSGKMSFGGITPISYFDLFNNYPIIKSSSKRDSFFKEKQDSEIKIINNEELKKYLDKKNIKIIYGEIESNIFTNIKIFDKIDYESIIQKIKFCNFEIITPLYIKKPNIS